MVFDEPPKNAVHAAKRFREKVQLEFAVDVFGDDLRVFVRFKDHGATVAEDGHAIIALPGQAPDQRAVRDGNIDDFERTPEYSRIRRCTRQKGLQGNWISSIIVLAEHQRDTKTARPGWQGSFFVTTPIMSNAEAGLRQLPMDSILLILSKTPVLDAVFTLEGKQSPLGGHGVRFLSDCEDCTAQWRVDHEYI